MFKLEFEVKAFFADEEVVKEDNGNARTKRVGDNRANMRNDGFYQRAKFRARGYEFKAIEKRDLWKARKNEE